MLFWLSTSSGTKTITTLFTCSNNILKRRGSNFLYRWNFPISFGKEKGRKGIQVNLEVTWEQHKKQKESLAWPICKAAAYAFSHSTKSPGRKSLLLTSSLPRVGELTKSTLSINLWENWDIEERLGGGGVLPTATRKELHHVEGKCNKCISQRPKWWDKKR